MYLFPKFCEKTPITVSAIMLTSKQKTNEQINRQTDRQTDKQTNGPIDKQTNKQTNESKNITLPTCGGDINMCNH